MRDKDGAGFFTFLPGDIGGGSVGSQAWRGNFSADSAVQTANAVQIPAFLSWPRIRQVANKNLLHAANAFNPRLEKDAADARIVVFSATAANSTAAELPELGHGVFTYALIEGLKGAADTGGDGVRLLGLADYIYRGVTGITKDKQKPFYYISSMENILLAKP